MLPKSGLACLFLLTCMSVYAPALAQGATDNGAVKISSIETKLFAHPYAAETLPSRMARLERFVYGSEQTGPLNERMEKLIILVNSKPESDKPNVVAPVAKSNVASGSVATKSYVLSSYPRVTELEKELLDQTFEREPVASRLSRLEGKVFGRSWGDADLAKRTDRLAEYAYVSPHVAQLQRAEAVRVSSRNTTRMVGVSDILPRGLSMLSAVHNISAVSSLQSTSQSPRTNTVVDEIESLEKMAYGKISASKPLNQRVDALEISFGGGNEKQLTITDRVATLMSKVMPNRLGV